MKIVLAPFGSLGDLHPMIAVAIELRARGHDVLFATNQAHEERIRALRFDFRAIRPHVGPDDQETVAYMMDLKHGPERMMRELIFPALRDMYGDLTAAVEGADVLCAGELVQAAPLVAEKSGIVWATHVLSPLSFFSVYDPPVVPAYPSLAHLYRFGPFAGRLISWFGHSVTKSWIAPVHELREELGLPRGFHPIFEGKFSPRLVLAMFSPHVAAPQPDWPPNTVVTGFSFYDGSDQPIDDALAEFLDYGEPPIVFTLGSAAVVDPGAFFQDSITAAIKLARRALLITADDLPRLQPPPRVHVTGYAPYSVVFPMAAAVVHQGGIGTTAQALRAGRPMIIVPYAFDQPDNAARMRRLGVSETIARKKYDSRRAEKELRKLLSNESYGARAALVGRDVAAENGASVAATALESLIP